ncbi:MAG: helix-turn-helix domain-containing protein [Candidatus Thermoplasmatota archaeon]|nr:helix-turn-helix domain-containing protein [Candidatus Thermoplasmatota archaeon]
MVRNKMGCLEATIELERSDCVVTNMIYSKLSGAEVSRLSIGREVSLHRVMSENVLDIITQLRQVSESVRKVGRDALWVESKSCSACSFLSDKGIPVVSSKTVDEKHVQYRVLLQSKRSVQHLLEMMEKGGLRPKIVEVVNNELYELTEREKEVLLFAFNHGYFDSERQSSLTDLAQSLRVSPSSLSDVMRRGLKKIVAEYLKK